ncbi:glutamate synthase large subunit [Commensalibacter papalotli (ex Botero et al. 2024)]|uniref:Glutamate synthase domain 1 (GltB1) (PDB:1EA0) n=1 Tax=Commensalibacter papalotli (ex Botero et al. 2024) TaxID=2972766 RepID=A0ABN8W8K5_9PROT|nr:glutamate synthase large subunit [Commensalibacter papalotli (ex Botero et al. 2024)]CAI3931392.1 Glutamate synthase domain 1 (GltB1) (PDB:1EA0) [Commensalibacter papalotli (ex Botero et al. 2024)]CAI3944252.1 Glutamate synthase domain 1 (GltB1) (PDB:1EA0) [Commensalibacter papalotli (ex Botero et al. 2024)]
MSDTDFIEDRKRNEAILNSAGVYSQEQEHDACGVGFVVALDGKKRRDVVEAGLTALKALWHRGAVDADGKTGDGAGIHVEISQEFFLKSIRSGHHHIKENGLAVGMVFLPKNDLSSQERCRQIIETEIIAFGYAIYGWRQVPINTDCIGEKANATRPEIEQILISNTQDHSEAEFERNLYIIRRKIEKRAIESHVDLYICSLSCRSVIYKGMFLAENVADFYPDLLDERFVSRFTIYHQRYSTNTFPTWKLAQPFRKIAHNGEINTLSGNINWMKSHETRLSHPDLDAYMADLKPVIQFNGSDTAALDNVFELLTFAGRNAPTVKSLMIPPAMGMQDGLTQEVKDMYGYANAVMEPWDGPAALCGTDGNWVIAGLDRNGLRPLRYTITSNNLMILGSETGMVRVPEPEILEKGRLGPGQTIGFDMQNCKLYKPDEITEMLVKRHDYSKWVKNTQQITSIVRDQENELSLFPQEELRRRQLAVGMTLEDMETVLQPMVESAAEAIGSMGDDTPLAVLSDRYRGLSHYFRQRFSQVTNPPIDSLRETQVMTLNTRLGNLGNILDESSDQCQMLKLSSPVLTISEFSALQDFCGKTGVTIDCNFTVADEEKGLRQAIGRICLEAEEAVRAGCTHVFLTDEKQTRELAQIPMILATAAVHTHLVRQSLRTFTSLNVRSADTLDVHSIAVLIGVGATTVNAYLAQECIADRHKRGLFGDMSLREAMKRYCKAVDKGLLKIMAKMGISVVASYRGGYNFEAIGLSRALVAEFFPGMSSRISGIGLSGIAHNVSTFHEKAWDPNVKILPIGGLYKWRKQGEKHALNGDVIKLIQQAVEKDSWPLYQKYLEAIKEQPPMALRDLFDFQSSNKPIPVESVENITQLRRRLISPGISLGALSPEAHETLAIAMNRIGARSDSGEGGEDASRYKPRANGDNASSAIKQIASGRFGVTAEYLNNCREIEIKVAQGAKPGEGGQLPGFKVTELIGKLRHAVPGVTLISPPPHHDIYSIEDLAQLIYDLKQINPDATVAVKLVASSGIGTIAAGVAKAKADTILISGHNGGTGASAQTSIKYGGIPWEMGLAEAHQVLMLNRLRHRITLRVDGGIKTGRDVVIAAMLGAEEFGIGTLSLIAMGCIMVRQCHSNTCPVGVCTQDENLRKKFVQDGADRVINLFSFIAEDVRNILASLGFSSLKEIIGRTDLLKQVLRGASYLDDLDLNSLLARVDAGSYARYCTREGRNEVPETLDAQMIVDAQPLFEHGEKMQLRYNVENTYRAIGTKISSKITRRFGMTGLAADHLTVRLSGSAGQSLGAFAVQGLKLEVFGDANDYVGKGLSGATIVVRPVPETKLISHHNMIIGNTVLYGATSGRLYAAGIAGERFAVRNSGAIAVVEGCGANGCEYMTGGTVVILGEIGVNFGAGFTGGMAFVYDPHAQFNDRVNSDSVQWQRVIDSKWEEVLRNHIEQHVKETESRYAASLLHEWQNTLQHFWHIVPTEYAKAINFQFKETAIQKSA